MNAATTVTQLEASLDRAYAEIERLRAALKGIEVYATSKEDAKGMAAKALLSGAVQQKGDGKP